MTYHLPQREGAWESPESVAGYARACLRAVPELEGWDFEWDRAIRRMGTCRPARRIITLSRHFVSYYLERGPEEIDHTIRHELAHALAWVHKRSVRHDAAWQYYCALLGIPGARATRRLEDFAPPRPERPTLYTLEHELTGEVYKEYKRKPRISPRSLRSCYIPGRKAETLGHLILRRH